MSKRKSKVFIIKFLKSIGYDGSVTMSEFIINYIEKFENGEDIEIRNMNILTDFLLKSKDPEIATPETIYKLHLHYEKIGDKFKEKDFLWKAASLNHPEALYAVAWQFQYIKNDISKAMKWYYKAADAGNNEALLVLAENLVRLRSTPDYESRIEAHKWKLYRYKYCKRYEDLYHRFRGIGIVYKPGKTDRFKKISYTYSGKDKRLSKLDKRLCIRGTRRYIGSISNGSNYKHCLCRINRHLNFWSDYYDE